MKAHELATVLETTTLTYRDSNVPVMVNFRGRIGELVEVELDEESGELWLVARPI